MMNNLTVEASELTRLYGGREAVSNVSFNLKQGEVLGFLGPNGAGKSTTMKMLTGNSHLAQVVWRFAASTW